jgi:cell division protein FtsI/penicillin-binding protein 2
VLRTRLLSGAFILFALLLIIRLYFVQIVDSDRYERDAKAQYAEQNPDTADRGNIYFTSKDGSLVSAAVMQTGWRIAILPKDVKDAEDVYARLNAITPVDRQRFFASAKKLDDPYEDVAFRISDESATEIRAQKLPGVLLVADQWRFYPGRELAAQTLGFVGYSGDSKRGVYGLEKSWDGTLSETGSELYVNPFAEIFANLQAAVSLDPAAHEGSIITSIEPSIEGQLEKTLREVMDTYTPKQVGGIVMEPKSGKIIALGVQPSFDPNTYNMVDSIGVFTNPLVEGRYELGSIMKPLTMASAIDSGAVTPQTTYDDTGCIVVSTYKICNYDGKARDVVPMQQVLSQSLNVGASFVATKTGYPVFTRYLRSLGFGDKTGIDLPNEVVGDLSQLGEGRGPAVNYDTAAFGQGIAVSPIEMTRALATLANRGTLPNPHVVTAVKYKSGITRSLEPGSGPQVYSASTTETVTRMLVEVFDKGLLNGELKMEHYTVAAKTGTAQIPKAGGGYIPGDVYVHSFFGYFPAYDPRFIVFLFAIEPHGQKYASATLAHPFADIAKYLINYYDIPPDR